MKELRVTLRDATVDAIEAEIAAGEASSASDLVRAALDAYIDTGMPTPEEMLADALEAEAEADATGTWYTAEEVMERIRKSLRG